MSYGSRSMPFRCYSCDERVMPSDLPIYVVQYYQKMQKRQTDPASSFLDCEISRADTLSSRCSAARAVTACSFLSIAKVLLTVSVSTTVALVFLSKEHVYAQDASDVARTAKAITVRIEGATQGSGVLVKREGNRYTVLTAWHVVGDNRLGEELAVFTPDGVEHQIDQGSVRRIGKIDMATLTFSSSINYKLAAIGEARKVAMLDPIYVSGFPLPTTAVPLRIIRILKGDVIANTTTSLPGGYQLLYSNPTLPGMSGGSVLNSNAKLVGIHGKAEKDDQFSESSGKAIATRTNMAVPITFYTEFSQNTSLPPIRPAEPQIENTLFPTNKRNGAWCRNMR